MQLTSEKPDEIEDEWEGYFTRVYATFDLKVHIYYDDKLYYRCDAYNIDNILATLRSSVKE